MTDHSPTPWELVEATEHHGPYICNGFGGDVCDLYAMSHPLMPSTASGGISRPVSFVDADANAAFIVKAVNNHDALIRRVAALELIIAEEVNPFNCRDALNRMLVEEICNRVPGVVGGPTK